uniref:HTH_21 domain-containing protein n=1 Tax=Heterorhabditis bacteriophora TaxID=37862 RepID=A0A1I7XMW5_HETBA
MAVHWIVKRYQELGTVKDRPRSGRSCLTSIRRIVKHELEFYSYEIRGAHILTEKMKVNRYEKQQNS